MAGLSGVEASEKNGAGWAADGIGDVGASVADAGGGETVEGGGVDSFFTVAA